MKSAYLIKPGRIELIEKSIPAPGEGEVLIRVKSALTCGTDLKAYLRGHPLISMPGPFGHEFSGVITESWQWSKWFQKRTNLLCSFIQLHVVSADIVREDFSIFAAF